MTRITRTWLFAASIAVLAPACGDDDGGAAAVECGGDGCTCTGAACACVAGADCHIDCGDLSCSLDCTMDTKCNAMSEQAVTLECHDTSECKGNGGPMSNILCDQMANCDLKAGAGSTAICRDMAVCKINLGPDSTISCEDEARCDLKCDAGCVVNCAATATCAVNCGPDEAGAPGMMCPDGRIVCGGAC